MNSVNQFKALIYKIMLNSIYNLSLVNKAQCQFFTGFNACYITVFPIEKNPNENSRSRG